MADAAKDQPKSEVATTPTATPPAINQKIAVQAYLRNDSIQKRIQQTLGKRSNQFVTALIAATSNVAHLEECTPASVINAAFTVAALDLPINNNLGFAYLIPYKNKGVYEAQFQMGYKGFIQLAQRSGQYKYIAATPVYEGQLIKRNPLTGNTYDWEGDHGDKIIGFLSYFQLTNGFEKELYMSVDEINKHAQRFSQAYRAGYGPWKDDYEAMGLKTVLKLLISKFGPMSVDMQNAIEKDQSVTDDDQSFYPDHVSEAEEKIKKAATTEEIEQIILGLPASDQKKLAGAAHARAKELEA
jgi:recombination protein RecT